MANEDRRMTREMVGWARMWGEIAKRFGDAECRNRLNGEQWQYMHTGGGTHRFRHRALDVKGYDGRCVIATVDVLTTDYDVTEAP